MSWLSEQNRKMSERLLFSFFYLGLLGAWGHNALAPFNSVFGHAPHLFQCMTQISSQSSHTHSLSHLFSAMLFLVCLFSLDLQAALLELSCSDSSFPYVVRNTWPNHFHHLIFLWYWCVLIQFSSSDLHLRLHMVNVSLVSFSYMWSEMHQTFLYLLRSSSMHRTRITEMIWPLNCTNEFWFWLNSTEISVFCSSFSNPVCDIFSSTTCTSVCHDSTKAREFACFIKVLFIYSNWFRALATYSHNFQFLGTHTKPGFWNVFLQPCCFPSHEMLCWSSNFVVSYHLIRLFLSFVVFLTTESNTNRKRKPDIAHSC